MKRLIQLAVLAALPLQAQTPLPKAHDDFLSKRNLALFSADMLVRSLDAQSTNANLFSKCGCYREDNIAFATGTRAGTWGYSLGVSGAVIGLSYVAHRTGHHKIERMLPAMDVMYDGKDVLNNYAVRGHK